MKRFKFALVRPVAGSPWFGATPWPALSVALITIVWGQTTLAQDNGAGGAGPAGGGNAPGPASSPVTTPAAGAGATPQYGTNPAAAANTGPIGGGNATGSSSRPISGPNDRDTFDSYKGGGGGPSYRGSANGGTFISGGSRALTGSASSDFHTVKRGDTLWEICDQHFQNPYQWPRIWSYNPQLKNPHWIYPGDVVKLRAGAELGIRTAQTLGGLNDSRRKVVPSTVFLRHEAYIEDGKDAVWGEITGSREDKMFLGDFDEVYVQVTSNRDVRIGQELTIFKPVRSTDAGKVVEIQGTLRVDQWDAKEHIARCRVIETIDTIERGARVGPMQRSFEVIPPVRNEQDVKTSVIASVGPYRIYGQNQLVFVGAGTKAGLKAGNRVFILRKGDAWHDTLPSRSAAVRIAVESDSAAATEAVTGPKNNDALPAEVVAELRVVDVRETSAVCVVTDSRREIEVGDEAFARKGY